MAVRRTKKTRWAERVKAVIDGQGVEDKTRVDSDASCLRREENFFRDRVSDGAPLM